MRALVLIDRYPPHHTGGEETSCFAVAEGLKGRGHQVSVLTSTYGVGKGIVEGNVHRLLNRPGDTPSLARQAKWELSDHRTVNGLLAELRPDAIICWGAFSLFPSVHIVMKESGLPVIYNMQNIWIDRQLDSDAERHRNWHRPGSSSLNRIAKPIVKTLVRALDPNCLRAVSAADLSLRYVVQCSRASWKAHQRAGFDGEDWTVIYNGIDLDSFQRNGRNKKPDTLGILFAGRLVESKGPHTLIEAVAELLRRGHDQLRVSIAGVPGYPPQYVEELHRLVEEERLNDQVSFLGAVPYSQMPLLFQNHQVLVFPSITPEGFPMTLIEAMACGLTIVGTTTGGSSEILLNDVNSLTFPPANPVELAGCLERLIIDSDLREDLARAGRQWVHDHCDIRLVIDQWEEYLGRVLEGTR